MFSKDQKDYLCRHLCISIVLRFRQFDLVVYKVSKLTEFYPVVFRVRFVCLFLMEVALSHQLGEFRRDPRSFIYAFDSPTFDGSVLFCNYGK